ncbi:MAG: hypothetical protein ACD_60C00048G0011 [uncultured bacterium]|nr:MAG: hypothetical protein ACD_60C00048G0011 [uncultured bacterium]
MNAKSIKKNVKSKTNLVKLHQKDDTDINYKDSPATMKKFWENAEVVMPAHKIHLSVRLDEDVVDYFKKKGQGYQSKINAVLKAYVRAHTPRS